MSGANGTTGPSPGPSSDQEHVLTYFGKTYPIDPEVGKGVFPNEYYNQTIKGIEAWYEKSEIQTGRGDLQSKKYTRPAPYDSWNAKTLGGIGVTEFLLNLSKHMNKLFEATAAHTAAAYNPKELKVIETRIRLIPYFTFPDKKLISDFRDFCSEACKILQILHCQVVDAILVNALAAVITMQKGHMKMNEQLLINSDPECPISVQYTGAFHSADLAPNAESPAIMMAGASNSNNPVMDKYEEQYEEHRRSKVQRLF